MASPSEKLCSRPIAIASARLRGLGCVGVPQAAEDVAVEVDEARGRLRCRREVHAIRRMNPGRACESHQGGLHGRSRGLRCPEDEDQDSGGKREKPCTGLRQSNACGHGQAEEILTRNRSDKTAVAWLIAS